MVMDNSQGVKNMYGMGMKMLPAGIENFEEICTEGYYYVDKTALIRELLQKRGKVKLFTRPRRFGKTLNLHMLECFFSNRYAGRSDLFEGLSIWKKDAYRQLQGSYPVIFLSFASLKCQTYESAMEAFKVQDAEDEASLTETVKAAHRQIESRNYDCELTARGIPAEQIHHYGFACCGKNVLIG